MDAALGVAREILAGFNKHYRIFREASVSARELFEKRRWAEIREVNRSRIDLYDTRAQETVEAVNRLFPTTADESLWPAIKQAYINLLYDHHQPELAETFFNTVAIKVLHRSYHNNRHIFSRPAVAAEHIEGTESTYRCYYPAKAGIRRTISQILSDFDFQVPWADQRRCMRNLVRALGKPVKREPNFHVQVLSSLFYRNKGAYAIGRVVNGRQKTLFAISFRHDQRGELIIDSLIHEREHLANLFSVAHAYFMVDMEVPSSWIAFIHDALPEKPKAELYTAVGLQKQGKTLFFRDLHQHMKHSADLFAIAPGVKGMVMLVFTLPSFPFVFKVIRDSFAPPKDTSREHVIEKYRLVKMHERVGRLADTLEYSHVAFPLARFESALLEEMRRLIPSNIEIDGEYLIIKHLYIEQRMTPLDLYLRDAGETGLRQVIREFGQALRDLAAANIFPGDMLPKNFGVSSYGRVLFYDYDEVCYLTDCNFRPLHQSNDLDDELRSEPWYSVGPNDIFPEEFPRFLFSDAKARELFKELYGDLLSPGFWTEMQNKIRAGTEPDLYPYPEDLRFSELRSSLSSRPRN
jgi:isocitrate dehydrogenase kinase/phosphatase